MSLPDKVEWWLLRADKVVTAEVTPSKPDRRAWVGIYPQTEPSIYPIEGKYLVRHFEVTNRTLDLTVNINKYIDEQSFPINEFFYVKDEEELEETLLKWMDDLNKLVLPYFCQYPI